jgi:hypothetical protein
MLLRGGDVPPSRPRPWRLLDLGFFMFCTTMAYYGQTIYKFKFSTV